MQEQENPDEAVECAVVDAPVEAILKSSTHKTAHRRKRSSSSKTTKTEDSAVSTGAEATSRPVPRSMRSQSFATAAIPIVTKDPAITKSSHEISRSLESGAASNLKDISSRSQPGTPNDSPVGSPSSGGLWRRKTGSTSMNTARSGNDADKSSLPTNAPHEESAKDGELLENSVESSSSTNLPNTLHKRQTIATTAAAARKWGLGLMKNSNGHSPSNSISTMGSLGSPADHDREEKNDTLASKFEAFKASRESVGTEPKPMLVLGGGQPLPPIGQPLPGPKSNNRMSWAAPLSLLRKKNGPELGPTSQPSPNPSSLHSVSDSTDSQSNHNSGTEGDRPPVLPPRVRDNVKSPSMEDLSKGSYIPRAVKSRQSSRRKQMSENSASQNDDQSDSILIITAPDGDTDQDSSAGLASPEPLSPEVSRSADGVLELIIDEYDTNQFDDDEITAPNGNSKTPISSFHRKPMPGHPSLDTSNTTDWATSATVLVEFYVPILTVIRLPPVGSSYSCPKGKIKELTNTNANIIAQDIAKCDASAGTGQDWKTDIGTEFTGVSRSQEE